ncbi:olfactory receptor 5AR1-like [Pleurodeles waltl]|uniref:olfactory receptor 5AR1-like n=1 Tax=Pleurodeles waltl TaxID=8319 RepID=UPI003709BEEE
MSSTGPDSESKAALAILSDLPQRHEVLWFKFPRLVNCTLSFYEAGLKRQQDLTVINPDFQEPKSEENMENQTNVLEFIIMGFLVRPELKPLLFTVSLFIYLLIICANLVIILTVFVEPRLKTPMYFFLQNLSFLDIFCTSVTFPKLLAIFLEKSKSISFVGCITQMYFFLSFTSTEFYLLAAMAYDRYVAIHHPLHYTDIMNTRSCRLLVALSWVPGFLDTVPHAVLGSQLSFCGSSLINHFFCDLTALVKLSCSDPRDIESLIFAEGVFAGLIPFSITITSYIYIIRVILKIRSAEGRHKAFSTCSSHLTVVTVLYVSMFCMYVRPASSYSLDKDKLLAIVYTAFIPIFNPLIYSLRNKDMNKALKKLIGKKSIA